MGCKAWELQAPSSLEFGTPELVSGSDYKLSFGANIGVSEIIGVLIIRESD